MPLDLALVQFKAKATHAESLAALTALLRAHCQGAQLVVCPEMALVGYDWQSRDQILPFAEPMRGPTAAALGALAQELGCWIVCGYPERVEDRVYNAALVIAPDGELRFSYRKTALFEADLPWATPGDLGYCQFHADFGTFAVGICMDLNDDAFLAYCAANQVDYIALPTNWVQDEHSVHDYWSFRLRKGWPDTWGIDGAQPDRAPVHAWLCAANSYGVEGAYTLSGLSAALRLGQPACTALPHGDAVLRLTLPD